MSLLDGDERDPYDGHCPDSDCDRWLQPACPAHGPVTAADPWDEIERLREQCHKAREMNSHLGHQLAEKDADLRRLRQQLKLLQGPHHE